MQVIAACVLPIKTNASVALNATVHFMVYERAQVLITECALIETIASIIVSRHDGHILQVALTAFVADLWFAKTRSAFQGLKLAKLDEESISGRNLLNASIFGLTTPI